MEFNDRYKTFLNLFFCDISSVLRKCPTWDIIPSSPFVSMKDISRLSWDLQNADLRAREEENGLWSMEYFRLIPTLNMRRTMRGRDRQRPLGSLCKAFCGTKACGAKPRKMPREEPCKMNCPAWPKVILRTLVRTKGLIDVKQNRFQKVSCFSLFIVGVPFESDQDSVDHLTTTADHLYVFQNSREDQRSHDYHKQNKKNIAGVPTGRGLPGHPITTHHSYVFMNSQEGSRCGGSLNPS